MSYNQKGKCRNSGKTHFKKGSIPWNKNKSHSEETLEKLREKGRRKRPGSIGIMARPWSEKRKKAQEARKGIPTRAKGKRKPKKPLHLRKPIIKNGKRYVPFWHELRKLIYKRDNWFCQECGIKCHNSIKIACHHIDYDVKNNNPSNLITLCLSCHAKTNFRRENWKKYFMTNPRLED